MYRLRCFNSFTKPCCERFFRSISNTNLFILFVCWNQKYFFVCSTVRKYQVQGALHNSVEFFFPCRIKLEIQKLNQVVQCAKSVQNFMAVFDFHGWNLVANIFSWLLAISPLRKEILSHSQQIWNQHINLPPAHRQHIKTGKVSHQNISKNSDIFAQ